MLKPGRVNIIDLSDSDSTIINNLVIAELLRGVQVQQELNYEDAVKKQRPPTPVLLFIEEALIGIIRLSSSAPHGLRQLVRPCSINFYLLPQEALSSTHLLSRPGFSRADFQQEATRAPLLRQRGC